MITATGKSAQQLLDEVSSLAGLEAFNADSFLQQVAEEGVDRLPAMLLALDAFAKKAMRIRLGHVLAADTALPTPFRTYLATQVLDYEGDLPRLHARVAGTLARTDPKGADDTAAAVTEAAGLVLGLRAALRAGVLALIPPPEPEPEEEVPKSREELIELD